MRLKGWIRFWHPESSGGMHYENTQAILEGILRNRQHLFGSRRINVITINWGSTGLGAAGFLKGNRATTYPSAYHRFGSIFQRSGKVMHCAGGMLSRVAG